MKKQKEESPEKKAPTGGGFAVSAQGAAPVDAADAVEKVDESEESE